MGVSQRAANEKQRRRLAMSKTAFSSIISRPGFEKEPFEMNKLQNDENICPHCGFKARYPFVRCPSCEKVKE